MSFLGAAAIRHRGAVHSAQWYGKLCTVVLETVMAVLILFPHIPERIVIGSIFTRSEALLRAAMEETLRAEALTAPLFLQYWIIIFEPVPTNAEIPPAYA